MASADIGEKPKKRLSKEERALEQVRRERASHKGLWITMDAAREYRDRAAALPENGGQDTGKRRELRMELQQKYGITEIEALNILNGRYISNYVDKYNRIKNEIIIVDSKSDDKNVGAREE